MAVYKIPADILLNWDKMDNMIGMQILKELENYLYSVELSKECASMALNSLTRLFWQENLGGLSNMHGSLSKILKSLEPNIQNWYDHVLCFTSIWGAVE